MIAHALAQITVHMMTSSHVLGSSCCRISRESSLMLVTRNQGGLSTGATGMQETEQRGIGSQQSSP